MTAPVTPLPAALTVTARCARRIADAMAAAGYDAEGAARAEEHEWQVAASIGEARELSYALKVATVALLQERSGR